MNHTDQEDSDTTDSDEEDAEKRKGDKLPPIKSVCINKNNDIPVVSLNAELWFLFS